MQNAPSIFVLEWFSGGGRLDPANDIRLAHHPSSTHKDEMLSQGWNMLSSIVSELCQAGFHPIVPIDHRLSPLEVPNATWHSIETPQAREHTIDEWINRTEYVLIIAPETDGCLAQILTRHRVPPDRLVSPNLEFIELTSDKSKTCETLKNGGINVPFGFRLDEWLHPFVTHPFPGPFILKPNRGAGSERNQLNQYDLDEQKLQSIELLGDPKDWRIESFQKGTPVSVSALCGSDLFLLPPTRQKIANRVGEWEGCEPLQNPNQVKRARRLAERAIKSLPETVGYIGIDMVLAEHPADDCVIEVNPRLTTSYERLRSLVDFNIAEKMIQNATNQQLGLQTRTESL